MIIRKTSVFTKKEYSMDINVTPNQIARWKAGELIQRVMPHLTPGERDFLKFGSPPEEMDKLLGPEEPDIMDAQDYTP